MGLIKQVFFVSLIFAGCLFPGYTQVIQAGQNPVQKENAPAAAEMQVPAEEENKNPFLKDSQEQTSPQEVDAATTEESEPVDTDRSTVGLQTGAVCYWDINKMTIDVPDHPLVEKYIKQYTSPGGKDWLTQVMKRGEPYRSYIENRIQEMNLPMELEFLPVIESSFVVSALSSSKALGLWQFMENSISPFGIRKNQWIDERLDPWLSTKAALKKLNENYTVLGSWEMALAAYNCGLGAATRAAKKAGNYDFWYLADNGYLPKQTVNYVPKFLAVSKILSNYREYGIEINWQAKTRDFETIETNKAVDIGILSEKLGLDKTELTMLNPALLYNVTPPGIKYSLNVPSEKIQEAEKIINSDELLLNFNIYTVRSGDTLYAMGLHYGVSVEMIQDYNNGIKPSQLRPGQKLLIPSFKEVEPYQGRISSHKGEFKGSYTVQKGDTLWSIALKYQVQVESLAEENNLSVDSILSIGKTLKVPILE